MRTLCTYVPLTDPDRLRVWLALGRANPWIARAVDPPFTARSFHVCATVEELADRLIPCGRWTLGAAFVLGDLCFIQQVDGGDEWLTIKGATAFESISFHLLESEADARQRLFDLVARFQRATEARCRALAY